MAVAVSVGGVRNSKACNGIEADCHSSLKARKVSLDSGVHHVNQNSCSSVIRVSEAAI
jgi:hypothetical protein